METLSDIRALFERASLAGQLGSVLCWRYDTPDAFDDACDGVLLIPNLLAGRTESFSAHEWSLFSRALERFPLRTETLERIYKLAAERAQSGASVIGQPSECFDPGMLRIVNQDDA